MKKFITKNLWIKISCIITATLLWVYIAASQNTVAKYPGSIKIKAINIPTGLVAIYDAKTVEIKIMADSGTLSKLSNDSFSAYVDLSSHLEGTYELPVNVVSSMPGVQIVERTPSKIIVSLETVISKEVGIGKNTEGSAGEGMIAGNIDLLPSKVLIKGPKSVINSILEATAIVHLNGETSKFSKNVALVVFDEKGEVINGIEIDPPEVSVTVAIVKASNNKTVGIKVKTSGAPKFGYYVFSINVTPNTVDITGPLNLLSDMAYIETGVIDITNQSTDIDRDVNLNIKSGLAFQVGSSSKARVKISFKENDSTKELIATINPINLPTNYMIVSYDPDSVKTACSGAASVVNNLASKNVTLTLDFADKQLSPGMIITFNLSTSDVKAPDGVTVIGVMPSSINVKVEKK